MTVNSNQRLPQIPNSEQKRRPQPVVTEPYSKSQMGVIDASSADKLGMHAKLHAQIPSHQAYNSLSFNQAQ